MKSAQIEASADAALLALPASLACALPTAYRAASFGGRLLDGLVIACGVLLVPVWIVMVLWPRAERGFRGVVGKAPSPLLGVGLALWLGLSALVLVSLGAVLKAWTNHRGLGGAAFGVLGAAGVCGAAVAATRVSELARDAVERGASRRVVAALMLLPLAAAGVLALLALGSGSAATLAARATLFDLLLAIVVVVFARSRTVPASLTSRLRLVVLALAVLVTVAGFVRVELSDSAAAVKRGGGLPASILTALELWSDRDGDGFGAHFGGRDCDEGDPRRRPDAPELPDDGIDSDCDGIDAPAGPVAPAKSEAIEPRQRPAISGSAGGDTGATESASASATATPLPVRPDVVLVTLDSVGARHCSLYGYARNTTPHLAELAARGTLFEHAYAAGSNTQRALMAVVSGNALSATPNGGGEWPRIDDAVQTIAERMKAAGYRTGAVTSFTWLRKDRGFDQGFDIFDETAFREQHPERMVTGHVAVERAIVAYEQLARGSEPLFLWVHLFDAHEEYLEHDGIDHGKDGKDLALGKSGVLYDGEVTYVDRQLGKILKRVAEGPRAARTLWVVHGSHGEAFGEHGDRGHGGALIHDEVLLVPLVMAGPAIQNGRYTRGAVSVLDVPPTVLERAGASTDGLAGHSLVAVLRGDDGFERPPVLAYATQRTAVVDWPLKLVVKRRAAKSERWLLFDLESDPGETKDLSEQRGADVRRLDAARPKENN